MNTEYNVATLTRFGNAPYFIFCDHASNNIPPSLNCLGMPEDMLRTHIAWDIGSADVGEALARKLNGTYFRCEFSRLIIDPNRALASGDLIPATSDQVPVPGNQMMNDEERAARIEAFHVPYHLQLDAALDQMIAEQGAPFIISVHSFTNRLMGGAEERPWKAGLLWREDEDSAQAMMSYLRDQTGWRIGDNEPYDARQFNYSVDRHIGPRNLSHITVEIRQDIINNDQGVDQVAAYLADGVKAIKGDAHDASINARG